MRSCSDRLDVGMHVTKIKKVMVVNNEIATGIGVDMDMIATGLRMLFESDGEVVDGDEKIT